MSKSKLKLSKSQNVKAEIRHLGVFIEHVNDGVKLIAEQYGDIKKDIGDIKQTLNSHTKALNSHTEMIGKLIVDMAIVKEDVEFIKGSLKKKVDIDEFSALERRVALLEKHR